MAKIGVKNITLTRAEGPSAECGIPTYCPSFDEANRVLHRWSHTAPQTGGYDKVDFRIDYEDDEVYKGRFDMHYGLLERDGTVQSLEQHIQSLTLFNAGLYKPAHQTEEQYRHFLQVSEAHSKDKRDYPSLKDYRDFIDKYDIGKTCVQANFDVMQPAKRTAKMAAAELWPTLDADTRFGFRFGLYPADLIATITKAGDDWNAVTSELARMAG